MIKRSKLSSPQRKTKQNPAKASDELVKYISQDYPDQLPISYISAITKKYNKQRVLHEEDKFIQRFVTQKGYVNRAKITEYIKNVPTYQPGQALNQQSMKRIYNQAANSEGKMTAQCLIHMAEEVGVQLTEKQAFDMIKKYGKRKQHLSLEDCVKINNRGRKTATSKSLKKQK